MTKPNTNAAWQARKTDAIARGEGNLANLYVEKALGPQMESLLWTALVLFPA